MIIKAIETEWLQDYKVPSMYIAFPNCSFKCEKECGKKICQNNHLATLPERDVDVDTIVNEYLSNPITKAVVCGGLEPFDSWNDLKRFVSQLREKTDDDIVVYTGYNENEICYAVNWLAQFPNIIIKFGRFIPNQQPHYDDILGVNLASDNQHARRIS